MRKLITAEVVAAEAAAGRKRIVAPAGSAIITPAAWSAAHELGVTFEREGGAQVTQADQHAPTQGSCAREVDASGVVVVRGDSVKLAPLLAVGGGKQPGVADLITGRDGSPMTAGVMAWSREDSFPWKLDYDEVDLVLEGVLHLTIDGRTLEGKPGDVLYLPKGSSVVFGTPWRTRVFYVTYPADWAAAKK